jgi:hypothetical protein
MVERKHIDAWANQHGIALNDEARADLQFMFSEADEVADTGGYERGFDDGKAEGACEAIDEADAQIANFQSNIAIALELIDCDRTAAKVYLDRAYIGLSLQLPKSKDVSCLL